MINRYGDVKPKDVREELTLLRQALDTCVELIVITDLEGHILDVNTATLQKHSILHKEDMIGENALDFIAPEDREKVATSMKRMGGIGYIENVEYRIITADGSKILVEANGAILQDKRGNPSGSVVIARDISERKKTEDTLLEREEKYRTVVERANDGITIIQDGVVKYANKRSLELIGYTPDEMIGTPIARYIHQDDLPKLMVRYERRMAGEEVEPIYEAVLLHKDSSRVDAELNAGLIMYEGRPADLVIVREITERRKAEEALRESEERFRSVLDNSFDMIYRMDLRSGNYDYISPASKTQLGYDPEEYVAFGPANAIELVHPDDVDMLSDSIVGLMGPATECQPTSTVVYRIKHKDLGYRWVTDNISVIRDDNGAPVAVVGNLRDITEQKAAEDAFRESEEQYTALVQNVADAVFRFKDGQITWANNRIEEILGYTREEMVGVDVTLFMPSEMGLREVYKDVSAALEKQGFFHGRTKARRKDGSIAEIEYSASLIPGKEPPELVGVARDITERKQAEEALLIKDNAIEKSLTAIAITDIQGTITYVNQACLGLWRIAKKEDVVGQSFWELLQLDAETANVVALSMIEHGQWQGALKFSRRNGEQIDVEVLTAMVHDAHGKAIQTITSFVDVTERKMAEERLRESERRYRLLAENVTDVIASTDMELNAMYLSPSYHRLLGFTVEEGMTLTINKALTPESLEVALTALAEQLALDSKDRGARASQPGTELEFYRKDGSTVWAEAKVSFIRDESGSPIGLVNVMRDITERKKMEQQLLLSGRLAAVGELSAGVAHELNNPLAAVQAFAQFLAAREDLDETMKSDVDTIYKEAQRASRITGNLLSFARKHNPEKSRISINEVVEKSLEMHSYRMKVNNIETVTELPPDLPMTLADYYQMQQVFTNIITNAEQAMTAVHGKGKLVVKTETFGKMIHITFTDDGPGIPKDNLKRLFDPFFTTKEVGEGTGLGLSICYGIMQEHGGRIYAEGRPGQGSTFVVELPLVSDDHAEIEVKSG